MYNKQHGHFQNDRNNAKTLYRRPEGLKSHAIPLNTYAILMRTQQSVHKSNPT